MEIQDEIVQQVVKAAAKKIDVDALAARLVPRLEEEIIKCVIESIADSETLYDVLRDTKFMKPVKEALAARLAAAFAP